MTGHAVILGSGIAGLLAAAALADTCEHITIVERDELPQGPFHRRGTPQSPHLHSVLAAGWHTMAELVPGLLDELVTAGAHVLADAHLGSRIHLRNGPYAFNNTDPMTDPAALATYLVTRPLLEWQLRRRVTQSPAVTILTGRDITGLIAAHRYCITGVTVADRHTGTADELIADIVVDATGRATRTPRWLEELGYPSPPQRAFTVHGVYHSQSMTIPDCDSFTERLVLVVPPDGAGRGGLIAGENGIWTLTVATHSGDRHPTPGTFADMLNRAQTFVPPHIMPALRAAQPEGAIATYRYPGGSWWRYDHSDRLPDGLFVVGDALCCLDPINGQGITMAALHARALRTHTAQFNHAEPQRFYRSLAPVIAPVWAANQPPAAQKARGMRAAVKHRLTRWTTRKILEAADDIVITEQLVRIANMVDPPQALLQPRVLAHVVTQHGRRYRRRVKSMRIGLQHNRKHRYPLCRRI